MPYIYQIKQNTYNHCAIAITALTYPTTTLIFGKFLLNSTNITKNLTKLHYSNKHVYHKIKNN
jgi:hypothetical protein